MSGILTRWSVLHEHDLTEADYDDAGAVRREVIASWIDAIVHEYLDQCAVFAEARARQSLGLHVRFEVPPPAVLPGRPPAALVTASASEFAPTSFVVSTRIRSLDGEDDRTLNVHCSVWCDSENGAAYELSDDVRDELIALEQAAQHYN